MGKHPATAADEILLAASYLRMRGQSAKLDEGQQSLANAAMRLDKLAHRVGTKRESSI